jgi:tetratricopeptide (TPR) repeat protein
MVSTRSSCARLLLLLVVCVVAADSRAPALSEVEGAALSQVEGPEALQKAAMLVQQGRLDQADEQARLALADPTTKAPANSVLGAIRLRQNRLEESAKFLQEAIRLESRLLGAHLNLAQVYALQEKRQLALGIFRRVLELDPQLANVPQAASIQFALLLVNEGSVPEAVNILERVRQTGPPSYEVAFNLGGAYVLTADPARALDAYDLALTLKPDSVPALRQAAGIAEQRNELERSLSYWMRARKIEPKDPEILLGFGRVCLKMDLLDDAEPALTEAAALKPGEPSYQYTLAAAKVGKRQFEAAQALLEPLVAKRPNDPQLQYALGSVFYIQGRLAEAAARLRESIRLQSDQLASHHYLALVARDQGHDGEAIEMLRRLLQRYPDHAPSFEALGGLLMSAGRYPEAESHMRKAVHLTPKSVKANYQLGLLLARMGKKEEADKQLELAKSLRKEDEATSRLQLRLLEPDR